MLSYGYSLCGLHILWFCGIRNAHEIPSPLAAAAFVFVIALALAIFFVITAMSFY